MLSPIKFCHNNKKIVQVNTALKIYNCNLCGRAFNEGQLKRFELKIITGFHAGGGVCVKDLEGSFRYPLGREGVYCPCGHVCIAHARQRVSFIVDLTVLRLAFFMGYG